MATNGNSCSLRVKNDSGIMKASSPTTGYNSYYSQANLPLETEEEEVIHKIILVGDSGVGKTSILVQYDQGKFQGGSFSATVGIGFTAHPLFHVTVGCVNQIEIMKPNGVLICQLSKPEPFDVAFKLLLVGDSGVGKTCLLVRFKDTTFLSGNFISTVGIDYRNKVVNVDGTKVKLQIWDTAGQERFRSVTHAYYRDAHADSHLCNADIFLALLLLYDVASKTSFDNTRAWLGEINEYAQEDVAIMLLGNKADMNHDRVIRCEDGERLAKEYNVAFMETSAKTGMNVELAFMAVAKELKSRNSPNPNESRFNVNDYVRSQNQRSGCCS